MWWEYRYRGAIPELLYRAVQWRHQPWSSNWRYLSYCWPQMQKQTQTKCVHDLDAVCGLSRMFIFRLRPHYIPTWRITVILIAGKIWIPPIGVPCWDKDGAGSGISGLYLWVGECKDGKQKEVGNTKILMQKKQKSMKIAIWDSGNQVPI